MPIDLRRVDGNGVEGGVLLRLGFESRCTMLITSGLCWAVGFVANGTEVDAPPRRGGAIRDWIGVEVCCCAVGNCGCCENGVGA